MIKMSDVQGLNVVYEKDIMRCQLCHCVEESNGSKNGSNANIKNQRMAQMQTCNHVYHIKCLIDYASVNAMKCLECNDDFRDCRLSLAVAYKHGNNKTFIKVLGGFD
jgi:hypothetical protein